MEDGVTPKCDALSYFFVRRKERENDKNQRLFTEEEMVDEAVCFRTREVIECDAYPLHQHVLQIHNPTIDVDIRHK